MEGRAATARRSLDSAQARSRSSCEACRVRGSRSGSPGASGRELVGLAGRER